VGTCSNWLLAGSLRSGERAAAIMRLIQSARLNEHDPYTYLKDILTRLPAQRAREIAKLLLHGWQPTDQARQGRRALTPTPAAGTVYASVYATTIQEPTCHVFTG
jgi:hypothetical protein